MEWLKNERVYEIDNELNFLNRTKPQFIFQKGEPKATYRFSVVELSEMGVCGVYKNLKEQT